MIIPDICSYSLSIPVFWNLSHFNGIINKNIILLCPSNKRILIPLIIVMMKTNKNVMHIIF